MLHTKFRRNRLTGSWKEYSVFCHIWTWQPSRSHDQHHVNGFSYIKAYIQNLVENGPVVSEKRKF